MPEEAEEVQLLDDDQDDILPEEAEETAEEISIPSEEEVIRYILDYLDEDENVNLAEIGAVLKQKYLGFDARNYGYKSMTSMIKNHFDCFDLIIENARDGIHKIMYISKK